MLKKRIDGRRLAQNVGEQIILLGTVGKVRVILRNYVNTVYDLKN